MPHRRDPVDDFCCPKCRNRKAVTRRASIAKGSIADILGLKVGGRYLLVTCNLCGFTELYDQALPAQALEAEAAAKIQADAGQEA